VKDFIQKSPSVLRRLDPGAKLVYTAFLVLSALGLLTAALLHTDGMGVSAADAAAWWRGDEARMLYPKSYRQLVELTHFHLFTEPVTFLVLAHLYNLGGSPAKRRVAVTLGTIGAMVAQLALPWLVTYGSAHFALLLVPVHVVLVAGLGTMIVSALGEMWTRPPSS
jgi:hypothetical protein